MYIYICVYAPHDVTMYDCDFMCIIDDGFPSFGCYMLVSSSNLN